MTPDVDPHMEREALVTMRVMLTALSAAVREAPGRVDARLLAGLLEGCAKALKDAAAQRPPTSEVFVDALDAFRAIEPEPFRRAGLRMDVASAAAAILTTHGGAPMEPGKLAEALRRTAAQVEAVAAADRAFYGEPRAISAVHAHQPTPEELMREFGPKPKPGD